MYVNTGIHIASQGTRNYMLEYTHLTMTDVHTMSTWHEHQSNSHVKKSLVIQGKAYKDVTRRPVSPKLHGGKVDKDGQAWVELLGLAI